MILLRLLVSGLPNPPRGRQLKMKQGWSRAGGPACAHSITLHCSNDTSDLTWVPRSLFVAAAPGALPNNAALVAKFTASTTLIQAETAVRPPRGREQSPFTLLVLLLLFSHFSLSLYQPSPPSHGRQSVDSAALSSYAPIHKCSASLARSHPITLDLRRSRASEAAPTTRRLRYPHSHSRHGRFSATCLPQMMTRRS
jgi:hypothetical protein